MTGQEEVPGASGVGLGRYLNCCRSGLRPYLTPHLSPPLIRTHESTNTTKQTHKCVRCGVNAEQDFSESSWSESGSCTCEELHTLTNWAKLQDTGISLFLGKCKSVWRDTSEALPLWRTFYIWNIKLQNCLNNYSDNSTCHKGTQYV